MARRRAKTKGEWTTDAGEALEALAAHMGWRVTRDKGASMVAISHGSISFPPRHVQPALALLADVAMGLPRKMTVQEVQEVCKWNGFIRESGLSGWEYGTLAMMKDVFGTEWRNVRK